jgi:hypothetical protein
LAHHEGPSSTSTFKGGASGPVEVYHGAPGALSKVIDVTGSYTSAINIVRVYHEGTQTGWRLQY